MKRIIILSMLLFVALAPYAQKKKTVQKKPQTEQKGHKTTRQQTTTRKASHKTTRKERQQAISTPQITGLQKERAKLQQDIKNKQKEYKNKENDVRNRLDTLVKINTDIYQKQKTIDTIQSDIKHIDGNIDTIDIYAKIGGKYCREVAHLVVLAPLARKRNTLHNLQRLGAMRVHQLRGVGANGFLLRVIEIDILSHHLPFSIRCSSACLIQS